MKFLYNPVYLFMALVIFLTMFTYIASGEPNRRTQNELTENGLWQENFDIAKTKGYYENSIAQKHKRSAPAQGNDNQTLSSALPKCCYLTESKIDERINKHKNILKTLRSCKAHKRERTCGSQVASISNDQAKGVMHEDNLHMPVTASNIPEESHHNENEMQNIPIFEKQHSSSQAELHKEKKKVTSALDDTTLFAIDQYFKHYGAGEEEIKESIGELNLKRLETMRKYNAEYDHNENEIWSIDRINSALNSCQIRAMSTNDYKLETVCYRVKHVLRSHYYNDDISIN